MVRSPKLLQHVFVAITQDRASTWALPKALNLAVLEKNQSQPCKDVHKEACGQTKMSGDVRGDVLVGPGNEEHRGENVSP